MLRVVLPLLLVGCIPTLPYLADPCAVVTKPGLYRLPLRDLEGIERTSLVFLPRSEGPRDLVFMLHGAGQLPERMDEISGWTALAAQEGFVAIYPASVLPLWNVGTQPEHSADDIGFLDLLAAETSNRLCGDRVLAVGFSNGGSMTYAWSCNSDVPDAIVPTEGAYLVDDCPNAAVPTRIYHGTGDTTAPYEGGTYEGVRVPSIPELAALKAELNACDPEPASSDKTGAQVCDTYSCDTSLVVCTLNDWTHLYPGGENTAGEPFDATAESWAWFEALPRTTR